MALAHHLVRSDVGVPGKQAECLSQTRVCPPMVGLFTDQALEVLDWQRSFIRPSKF
jgi:hypothetical protein